MHFGWLFCPKRIIVNIHFISECIPMSVLDKSEMHFKTLPVVFILNSGSAFMTIHQYLMKNDSTVELLLFCLYIF